MSTELKELALKIMDSNMTDDTKVEALFYMFSHIEKPDSQYDPYNLGKITWTGCTIPCSNYNVERITK